MSLAYHRPLMRFLARYLAAPLLLSVACINPESTPPVPDGGPTPEPMVDAAPPVVDAGKLDSPPPPPPPPPPPDAGLEAPTAPPDRPPPPVDTRPPVDAAVPDRAPPPPPPRPDAAPDTRPPAPDLQPDLPPPPPARMLPLKLGATWTYQVTEATGAVGMKKTTVEAFEDVGGLKAGTKAFRMRTDKAGGDDKTVSWLEDRGDMVVRHREVSYKRGTDIINGDESWQPFRMRVDERMERVAAGATWTETYSETVTEGLSTNTTMVSDRWIVDAADEMLTVPAGTFRCLRVRKLGENGKPDKTFWFARGVGKIKETGGQTEELASFSIP